jgi:hypothetical protein
MEGLARCPQPVFAFGIALFANEHQRSCPYLLPICCRSRLTSTSPNIFFIYTERHPEGRQRGQRFHQLASSPEGPCAWLQDALVLIAI